jgi:aromatic-L-amino-acid decarboxylase
LLREHIRAAQQLARRVDEHPGFERMAPAPFSLVCFRYRPPELDATQLDSLNEQLLNAVNASGEFFLSHTKLNGQFVIRVAVGNIHTAGKHLDRLWELLLETTEAIGQSAKR